MLFFLEFVTSSLKLSAFETFGSFGAGFVFSPSLLYLTNKIYFFGYKILYFGPFKMLVGGGGRTTLTSPPGYTPEKVSAGLPMISRCL